jgi:hypothetical protein
VTLRGLNTEARRTRRSLVRYILYHVVYYHGLYHVLIYYLLTTYCTTVRRRILARVRSGKGFAADIASRDSPGLQVPHRIGPWGITWLLQRYEELSRVQYVMCSAAGMRCTHFGRTQENVQLWTAVFTFHCTVRACSPSGSFRASSIAAAGVRRKYVTPEENKTKRGERKN